MYYKYVTCDKCVAGTRCSICGGSGAFLEKCDSAPQGTKEISKEDLAKIKKRLKSITNDNFMEKKIQNMLNTEYNNLKGKWLSPTVSSVLKKMEYIRNVIKHKEQIIIFENEFKNISTIRIELKENDILISRNTYFSNTEGKLINITINNNVLLNINQELFRNLILLLEKLTKITINGNMFYLSNLSFNETIKHYSSTEVFKILI